MFKIKIALHTFQTNIKRQKVKNNQYIQNKINNNSSVNQLEDVEESNLKKSVKFNFQFPNAQIQDLILNEQELEFNKFYENISQQFTDPDFPPSQESLTKNIKTFPKASQYIWLRAPKFCDQKPQVFYEDITPHDIRQGSLGDCYFLSSLSVLAERSNLVKRLFVTQENTDKGCYCLWMCVDGEWKQIIIDDNFPCDKTSKKPAFSSANGPELWVLIMEKAYAKIHGTYDKIEAGQTIEALRDLTGAPGKTLKNENADEVWNFILTNERKKFLLTCGSQSDDRGLETKKESGIVSSHAYGILDAQDVGVARLIQIRNPWGSMEWKGDWSDKSSKWTPEIRKKIGFQGEQDDGIFWMDVKDYIKEFAETSVNYLHEDYFYSSQRFENCKKILFSFKVSKNTNAYFSLNQKSERHFAKIPDSKYQYSILRLFICQIDQKNQTPIKYIGDAYSAFRDAFFECDIEKGTYIACIEVDWQQKICQDAIFSIYSSEEVDLNDGTIVEKGLNFDQFLNKCVLLKDFEQAKGNKHTSYEECEEITRDCASFGGYLFFFYKNKSKDFTLDEEINLQGENVQITEENNGETLKVDKQNNSFKINLKPNEQQIVKYLIQSKGKGAFSYGFDQGYSVNQSISLEKIIQDAKNSKDKGQKREDYEIYVKPVQFPDGFIILYMNQTKNIIYKEELELNLQNLEIDNKPKQMPLEIEVKPGQTDYVLLKIIDKSKPSKYSMGYGYQFDEV